MGGNSPSSIIRGRRIASVTCLRRPDWTSRSRRSGPGSVSSPGERDEREPRSTAVRRSVPSAASAVATTGVDERGDRERQDQRRGDDRHPEWKEQIDDNDDGGERNDPLPAL